MAEQKIAPTVLAALVGGFVGGLVGGVVAPVLLAGAVAGGEAIAERGQNGWPRLRCFPIFTLLPGLDRGVRIHAGRTT
jgi:hypothetical protein